MFSRGLGSGPYRCNLTNLITKLAAKDVQGLALSFWMSAYLEESLLQPKALI